MIWLLALLLGASPASAKKVVVGAPIILDAGAPDPLGASQDPIDAAMARFRAETDWYKKCQALEGIERWMKSDLADEAFAKRAMAVAQDVGHHDPENQVRYCAGSLAKEVEYWRQYRSPDARGRAEAERRARDRETLLEYAFPVAMILVLLVGGLISVATQIAGAYLIVHGDRLLEEGGRGAARLFLRHPAFWLIPFVDTALFSSLAALSYWRVLHDPRIFAPGSGAVFHARVLAVIYQPTSLLAVAAAFCALMLLNAAYVSAEVRQGRGEDEGLLGALRDALGSARDVLLLSFAACCALIGLDWAARKAAPLMRLREQVMARFAAVVVESAVMLGVNVAFCAMVFEKKDAVDAVPRAVEIVKPNWRSGLRAVAATSLLRSDVFVTPVFCCGLCTYPMWMIFGIQDAHTNWLLSGGLEFIGVACVGLGAVFSSFILSMVWLLDASFAAAFYLHENDGKALPENVLKIIEGKKVLAER